MNPDAARDLAAWLQDQHHNLQSWRKVAALYPPIVKPGTLNRIAKSGGEWLPRDRKILRALGLIEAKTLTSHERRVRREIAGMAKETREEVLKK